MIYGNRWPERVFFAILHSWQDASEGTPYALRGTEPKVCPKRRRVEEEKNKFRLGLYVEGGVSAVKEKKSLLSFRFEQQVFLLG